jgi:ubiquinone biosynthesis monooxygenase Coq6
MALCCSGSSFAAWLRRAPARQALRRLASTSSTAADYTTVDVAIVGGGVVGSALAARLARSPRVAGLKVAVIEAAPPTHSLDRCTTDALPDPRVFAITPASQRLLADCGAWPAVARVRAPAYSSMQVWDALGPGYFRFESSYTGDAQLGWIVENRLLHAALFDVLQAHVAAGAGAGPGADVSLHCPAGLRSLWLPPPTAGGPPLPAPARQPPGGGGGGGSPDTSPHALARLELTDGTRLKARLVVGADGAASGVRAAARIGTWGWDYDQRGVVATVRTAAPHATAWQRFLPEGPLAVLPLWGDLSSVVWSTTPAHAEALCDRSAGGPLASPQAFTAALNAALSAPPSEFQAAMAGGSPADGAPAHPFGGMGAGQAAAAARGSGGSGSASASSGDADGLYHQATDALSLDPLSAVVRAGAAAADALAALAASTSGEPWLPPPVAVETRGPRLSFPFRMSKANSYVGPRVALIGDAAHSVHPLAGQGLNLGLGDAEELAACLAGSSAAGADPGSLAQLRRYGRARAGSNLVLMGAMDGIKRAFTSRPGAGPGGLPVGGALLEPWTVARNVGMALLQGARPLKVQIARYAAAGAGARGAGAGR